MRFVLPGLILFMALGALANPPGPHDWGKFHGSLREPKVNFDSLHVIAQLLAEAPRGKAILDACFAKYGGRKNLSQLESFRLTYRVKTFMGMDSMTIVKSFLRGRRYRIDKSNEIRSLDGRNAWYAGRDTIIPLDQGRYRAELFSYLTLAMPLGMLEENFENVRYGTRQDDPLAYFYMEKPDSLLMVIGIDPADHLIKSSTGVVRQEKNSFVFVNRFSDHVDYEGYLFPRRLTNVSMGLKISESLLERVEIGPEFEPSYFDLGSRSRD